MVQVRALLIGRHRALALVTAVAGVIGSAASIGIAIWRRDALALLLPLLLSYLIPILLLRTPRVGELCRPSELTWSEGAALVKIGVAGVVTAPMYWLLSSSDRWFLERFHGPDAVGVYSIGYSVAIVGMMINVPVMGVWQPEAAREYEEDQARARVTLGRLMSRLIAAMAVVWLAATAAGGDVVRWFANERFHSGATYVPYIAGGVFFYGVLRLATTGLLVAKQLKWAALWWLAGGLVCVVLNLVLVPRYGGVGAAITQTASFGFIAMGILATAQAKFYVHLDSIRLGAIMLALLIVGICMAPSWHDVAPLSLLMKLPVGVIVTLAVAAIIAPDWCAKGIDYLRRSAFS
jgi:O-antigen/teichoic acid export membrane protein